MYKIPTREGVTVDGYHAKFVDVDLIAERRDLGMVVTLHPGLIHTKQVALDHKVSHACMLYRIRKREIPTERVDGWGNRIFVRVEHVDRLGSIVRDTRYRNAEGKKQCCRCLKWKVEAAFYPGHDSTRDGLHSHCIECHQVIVEKYKEDHAETIKAAAKKWRENNREYLNARRRGEIPGRRSGTLVEKCR